MTIGRGTVVLVELDPTTGHQQRGAGPCVVPVTGTPGVGLLYPSLAPGQSGLARESFAQIVICDPSTKGASAGCSGSLRK